MPRAVASPSNADPAMRHCGKARPPQAPRPVYATRSRRRAHGAAAYAHGAAAVYTTGNEAPAGRGKQERRATHLPAGKPDWSHRPDVLAFALHATGQDAQPAQATHPMLENRSPRDAPADPGMSRDRALALMRECQAHFASKLFESVRKALDGADDLFDSGGDIPDGEVHAFREQLPAWQQGFERAIGELFEQRVAGTHRSGKRPDADASLSSLRVLTAFDHERQAALVTAVATSAPVHQARAGRARSARRRAPRRRAGSRHRQSLLAVVHPRRARPHVARRVSESARVAAADGAAADRADAGRQQDLHLAQSPARGPWRAARDQGRAPRTQRMAAGRRQGPAADLHANDVRGRERLPTDIVVPPASPETGATGARGTRRDIASERRGSVASPDPRRASPCLRSRLRRAARIRTCSPRRRSWPDWPHSPRWARDRRRSMRRLRVRPRPTGRRRTTFPISTPAWRWAT